MASFKWVVLDNALPRPKKVTESVRGMDQKPKNNSEYHPGFAPSARAFFPASPAPAGEPSYNMAIEKQKRDLMRLEDLGKELTGPDATLWHHRWKLPGAI